MWNIIKSIRFSIKHSVSTYVVIAFSVLFMILNSIDSLSSMTLSDLTGSNLFITLSSSYPYGLIPIVIVLIANVFAGDFPNKFINYEVLSGHKRNSIVSARLLLGSIYFLLFYIIVMVIPITVVSLINGWGYVIPLSDASRQFALLLVTGYRMFAFLSLMTFVFGNILVSGLTFAIEVMFTIPLLLMSPDPEVMQPTWPGLLSSVYNVLATPDPTNSILGFADGKDINMCEFVYADGLLPPLFGVSIIVSVVCIALMYVINEKRDFK